MKINPYIMLKGNCREAVEFYAKTLGGRIESLMTYGESPAAQHAPSDWADKIIHARVLVGDQLLMASDAMPGYQEPMQGFSVSLQLPSVEEVDRVFAALSQGGEVRMPLGATFFSRRFGMLVDRFGTPWMINCPPESGIGAL